MGSDWCKVSLGDVFNVKHGFAFKGEFFVDQSTNTILVTPGNFSVGGGFQKLKPKFYSGPVPAGYVLAPGQVIVTMTDLSKQTDTLGYPAVVPDDGNTWLHNQRIGLLEFKDECPCDPIFISYFLRSYDYRSWIIGSASGTTVKHTSPDRIMSYHCELPPLYEQRAIAHVLGTLDDRIELNRQMNETLEVMAQALFKSWFVDFDPVIDNALANGKEIPEELGEKAQARAALGDKRRPVPEEVRALFPDEFAYREGLGWIPKGWVVEPLGNITMELRRGVSPKYIEDGGVRVVNQRCIRNHEIDYSLAKRNDDKQRKVEGRFLEEGDLLINSTGVGTLGRMAQVHALDEPTVVDSHVTIARADRGKYKPYTFGHMMFSIESYVEAMGEGSTGQTELSRKNLAEIPTIVPPRGIQEIAEGHFCNLGKKAAFNSQRSYTLRLTRDTLLPKLLSGELRIPDAETMVERIDG